MLSTTRTLNKLVYKSGYFTSPSSVITRLVSDKKSTSGGKRSFTHLNLTVRSVALPYLSVAVIKIEN